MLFRKVRGSLLALVFILQVDSLLNQILDHFKATKLDGVVYGSLPIVVNDITNGTFLHKKLSGVYIAFPNAIENRGLTVSVEVIHI